MPAPSAMRLMECDARTAGREMVLCSFFEGRKSTRQMGRKRAWMPDHVAKEGATDKGRARGCTYLEDSSVFSSS